MNDEVAKTRPSIIMLAFSTVTHILLLAPVIYIVILSLQPFIFFSWHVICSTLGVGLLTMEGIFCVSGDAYMNWKVSRMNRGLIHLFLNLIGLLLVLIGMVIIIIGKIEYKKSHFVTLHGIISLISIIFAILIAASGFVVVFDKCLYHGCIRPIILKIMHSFGGILAAILLLAGLITGIYTGWWPGTCLGRSLTVASFVIAACYIFLKPILGIISRCRVLFEGVPNDNERELNNEY
ncbi:uncharacterized protein LOC107993468 [Apis cerana]|uniref:uncharacterized protein LOC107993468 n=1 Tax=Apis cerana TaxID=7461 RepID=UPI0007E2CB5F|nr:uncharacterized protein LOC107993468 [Apis cerana]